MVTGENMKVRTKVILLALTAIFCLAVQGTSYSEEKPLPSRIMPVIFVSGSNYEMGYQYGYQMAAEINAAKDEQWAFALSKYEGDYEKLTNALKGFQYYIKKWTPEIIDELIGMAVGATDAGYPMSYVDTLVTNIAPWVEFGLSPTATCPSTVDALPPKEYQDKHKYYPRKAHELSEKKYAQHAFAQPLPDEPIGEGCSRWAVWGDMSKDGKLLVGDSCDGCGPRPMSYIAFPDKGHPFIASASWPGELYRHPGMNTKGFYTAGGALMCPRDIDRNFGLVPTLGLRHLTQFFDDANEALKAVSTWSFTGGRVHNWMLVDTKGNAYVTEMSAAVNTYRKPGDFEETKWISAMNTFLIPENRKALGLPDEPFPYKTEHTNARRLAQVWAFFKKYPGQVDLEFGKMMYRYQDDIEPKYRYINHRGNDWVTLARPAEGDKGVWYTCTGTVGRGVIGPIPVKGAYPYYGNPNRLQGTSYSFYTIHLKSNPEAITAASEKEAGIALAEADMNLRVMDLNPQTIGTYLALKEMFLKAQDSLYRGRNYLTDARLTAGKDSQYLYSKAITAFGQAEAEFNELNDLLKPPPTTPAQLGLPPIEPPRVE